MQSWSAWSHWLRLLAFIVGWCIQTHMDMHMNTMPKKQKIQRCWCSVLTMDSSQRFKIGRDKVNWANNAERSFLALLCRDCEPFLEARKWKCFVWVYAGGVLCQDVWLFRLLRDCHCEDYKSACLRSVPLLKSPAMLDNHRCRNFCYSAIIWCMQVHIHANTVSMYLCVHLNFQCICVWKHRVGCENRETDTYNETNRGEQRQKDQRKKIEEAERRGLTSGYWSLTRYSKKETTIKEKWQEKIVSNQVGQSW